MSLLLVIPLDLEYGIESYSVSSSGEAVTNTPESLDAADDNLDGDRGERSSWCLESLPFPRPKKVALVVHLFDGFLDLVGLTGGPGDFVLSGRSDLRLGLAEIGFSRFSLAALCKW